MKPSSSWHDPKRLRPTLLRAAFALCLLLSTPRSQAGQIACGQTVTTNITGTGQTDGYPFYANAGEAVVIGVEGQPYNPYWFDAAADLYDPNGKLIGSCTNSAMLRGLTTNGLYNILVHADDYAHTGQYGLSLCFATGRCGAPLFWGLPVTNALTSQGQIVPYTFWSAGREVVNISTEGQPYNPYWFNAAGAMFDPTGTLLGTWINGGTNINLAYTGTYTVMVAADDLDHMGTYSMSLNFTSLVPAMPIGITNGAAVLTLRGAIGNATTIWCATNMDSGNNWSTLTNFTLPWMPYRFVDWSSTNVPQRFYYMSQP